MDEYYSIKYIEKNFSAEEKNRLEYYNEITKKWEKYHLNDFNERGGFPHPNEAKYPINSIVIKDKHKGIFYVLSLKAFDKTKSTLSIDPKKIKFKHCKTEEILLKTFIDLLKKEHPDILIGYYSKGFDDPYLINRCFNVLSDNDVKKMSIIKKVSVTENEFKGKLQYRCSIGGIVLLDFLELYKKYTFVTRESYSLDYVSNIELGKGVGKIKHEAFDNFAKFWDGEPEVEINQEYDDILLKKARIRNIIRQKLKERKINY